jgi:predicted SAM-dependent methyltransferase
MKLHLGCGNVHIDGFINIDIRYLSSVDKVDNVRFLRSFEKNSIELIYASHVLEHFSRWDVKSVLARWYDILQERGILRLAVPDFESICKYYLKTKQLRDISGMLYGGQDFEENYHKWIWDFNQIEKEMIEVGFKEIKRYDWRFTEHKTVDDYSQSYLPHLDKINGELMSLNIEAIK